MSFKTQVSEFLTHMPLARFSPVFLQSLKTYNTRMLSRDVSAGLTVGMVALPLAMAFGIASGVPPEAGLYTAIIAGFIISLLGGCRVQIGGPAGAFVADQTDDGVLDNFGVHFECGNRLVTSQCTEYGVSDISYAHYPYRQATENPASS